MSRSPRCSVLVDSFPSVQKAWNHCQYRRNILGKGIVLEFYPSSICQFAANFHFDGCTIFIMDIQGAYVDGDLLP